MKKIFVCLLAVAALASCQKNEIISTVGGPAISFENAFVDNATKAAADPSYSNTNIFDQFYVWGYMDDATGIVFSEERVAKDINNADLTQVWKYANTQYWAPNHTYTFEAVTATDYEAAAVNVTTNTADVVTVDFVNENGTNDLLYATATVTTPAEISAMAPVQLVFSHLLSKVKFSFTNGFGNDNAFITVKNIKMTVPGAGTWAVDGTWTLGNSQVALAFGDMETAKLAKGATTECQNERLSIPAGAAQKYDVTFDVELYYGEVLAYSNTLLTTIEGAALEAGKAYNFHATIDASNIVPGDGENDKLMPIEFTASVTDWVDGGVYEGGNINTSSIPVLDVTEIAAGETKVLTGDAQVAGILKVAGDVDGAGHTLFAVDGVNYVTSNTARLLEVAGGASVKNVTIDGKGVYTGEFGIRGIYTVGTGDITLENVEILNCTYSINANNAGKLTVLNSTLQGWNSYGETTINHFENVKFIDGQFHNFRPYNNTVCKNCDFGTGVVIDLSHMVDGATIEFEGCTVNGVALTAANLTDAPATGVTIK